MTKCERVLSAIAHKETKPVPWHLDLGDDITARLELELGSDFYEKTGSHLAFFGDDWGQQKGLIMGPNLWREFIKPYIKRMYDHVKSHGMFVAQHSCGDISDIFSDLVSLGLDIYNTFQPEVYDVDMMKKMYGSQVTFYGGISTQRLLPAGTPDDVERETRHMLKTMGAGGGYICAPTHAMPNDIPTENVLAFLRAVQNQPNEEYGYY